MNRIIILDTKDNNLEELKLKENFVMYDNYENRYGSNNINCFITMYNFSILRL